MAALATVAWLLLAPLFGVWLSQRLAIARLLGPVVFAYLFGLIASLWPWMQAGLLEQVRDLAILLAIPLLLFSLDLRGWLQGARATIVSFLLCLLALLLSAALAGSLFSALHEHAATVAGMLTGMYSGGAPNMAVVHRALDAPAELFVQVNAIDFVSGAAYFLFLITLAAPVYGRFLKRSEPAEADVLTEESRPRDRPLAVAGALTACALIVAGSVLAVQRLSGELAVAPIMLSITSLAVLASFWPKLRAVRSSYGIGYYLVCVFCCALGSQLDLAQLQQTLGPLLALHLSILLGTITLHLLFVRWAGIDRDTAIITQTAALYGPPFVPPVAGALNSQSALLSGLSTGLLGYAVGNYLGIAMARLLQ